MRVMTLHQWIDEDVKEILFEGHESREIVLKKGNEGTLVLNKEDVVALAKEFGLVVYPENANL